VPNDVESVRFLAQSTFGATTAEVARLERSATATGSSSSSGSRERRTGFRARGLSDPDTGRRHRPIDPLYQTFWKQAITAPDALRQRMICAVRDLRDLGSGRRTERAAYAGVVSGHAVDPARQLSDLLEAVAKHPAMAST
jgi:uncharacterized protein (DUF1800 family)